MFTIRQDDGVAHRGRPHNDSMPALLVCLLFLGVARDLAISQSLGAETTPSAAVKKEKVRPEALVVASGARNIESGSGAEGSLYVTYNLTDEYPARKTLEHISSRLKELGWVPLKEVWLDPSQPSSHVVGWDDFLDALTAKPPRRIHQWVAQWKDTSGNLVAYTLRYEYPGAGPRDLRTLRVNAAWFSAASVKALQRDVAERRNQAKKEKGKRRENGTGPIK